MMDIRQAKAQEFEAVRQFYHTLIDRMQGAPYHPMWEKGVYPADEQLRKALARGELAVGEADGAIVAAMIVNQEANEGYKDVRWPAQVGDEESAVIHALGVSPEVSGRGLGKQMVYYALESAKARGLKAVRLDVLQGNLPAQKLYTSAGFQYVDTVRMYYADTGWTDFLLYEYRL